MPETNDRIQRILTKFRVTDNGCHEWTGACNQFGYGQALIRVGLKQYRNRGVHRLAWQAKNGEIPAGAVIMHTCDNRRCINIDHLRLGTQRDNLADMHQKVREGAAFSRIYQTYRAPAVPTPPSLDGDKLKIWLERSERP